MQRERERGEGTIRGGLKQGRRAILTTLAHPINFTRMKHLFAFIKDRCADCVYLKVHPRVRSVDGRDRKREGESGKRRRGRRYKGEYKMR